MRIPDVRGALLLIADEVEREGCGDAARKIRYLVTELVRRHPRKRAPVTSLPVTPAMKEQIREFYDIHPMMANRDIGKQFGVDGGRVSEVLSGYRE